MALAKDDGYLVVAGCLKEDTCEELRKLGCERLVPAVVDVTSDGSVADFVGVVGRLVGEEGQGRSLHAVVNNAGVGNGGAVDWLSLDNFRFDMEVHASLAAPPFSPLAFLAFFASFVTGV